MNDWQKFTAALIKSLPEDPDGETREVLIREIVDAYLLVILLNLDKWWQKKENFPSIEALVALTVLLVSQEKVLEAAETMNKNELFSLLRSLPNGNDVITLLENY